MKRGGPIMFFVFLLLLAAVEYYSIVSIKYMVSDLKPLYKYTIISLYALLTISWIAMFVIMPSMRGQEMANKALSNFLIMFFMGLLISKIVIALFLFLGDAIRFFSWLGSLFFTKETIPQFVQNGMSRSDFIQKGALLISGTLIGTFIYGMANRYRYNIKRVQIAFDHLPSAFKGLKIVHISDIHSGSFNNVEAVARGVKLINEQKPDVIFFTGDLVNNRAREMDDYIAVFKKLKATHGVYSILGNHDYGDYIAWENEGISKEQNLDNLKQVHKAMGWNLMLNEHTSLEIGGEEIAIIGVENTSAKGFHSYGDLSKAYYGAASIPFKILLSHDPSHWDAEVRKDFSDIALTLSGHTHGMQFGIDLSWLKWSPVQYMYKQWAGLYQEGAQFLYVNRGFGFLGYPGRVGILPEITVIELT